MSQALAVAANAALMDTRSSPPNARLDHLLMVGAGVFRTLVVNSWLSNLHAGGLLRQFKAAYKAAVQVASSEVARQTRGPPNTRPGV